METQRGAARGRRIELRNGLLIDVIAGRPFDRGVRVLLEHGRIAALPGMPGQSAPEPDLVVDLSGRTVVPGLFNTHVHVAMPMPGTVLGLFEVTLPRKHGREQVRTNLTECLSRGITTVRDTLCEDLRIACRLKSALASGELKGPRLHQSVLVCPTGGTFAAPRTFVDRLTLPLVGLPVLDPEEDISGVLPFPPDAPPSEVRTAVDRAIDARGAEHIKLYDQREHKLTYRPGAAVMTQAQMDAAADQARRRGVTCTVHQVTVESFRRAVRAGVTSLAHMPIDAPLTEDDVLRFRAAGCFIEPTASLAYFYSWAREVLAGHSRLARLDRLRTPEHRRRIEGSWVPRLRPLVRGSLDRVAAGVRRTCGVIDVSPVFRYFAPLVTRGFDNLRLIRALAGVDRIACGNDAGPCPSTPAGVGLELEMLELGLTGDDGDGGLAPADALRIATITSAKAMGVDDRLGSIEVGKAADLAVLDGDPLRDPRVLGRPVSALFLDGDLVIDRCGLDLREPRAVDSPGTV
jgi:imidazolonepropionase-like amidohydrolase